MPEKRLERTRKSYKTCDHMTGHAWVTRDVKGVVFQCAVCEQTIARNVGIVTGVREAWTTYDIRGNPNYPWVRAGYREENGKLVWFEESQQPWGNGDKP